jgi:predicted TPR repeat methyltransferase
VADRALPDDKMPPEHYQSLGDLEGRYWWHQTRYRVACDLLRRHRADLQSLAIADVGCGTGGFLRHLRALGVRRMAGFDYSANHLRSLEREGIDAHPIDLEAPFVLERGPYDVIASLDVLEHLENERVFLQASRANLRAGGVLLLTLPAHDFLFSEWDRRLKHFRRYSMRGLRQILDGNGFRVVESSYFFSFVFPLALLRRWTGAFDGREACEFPAS